MNRLRTAVALGLATGLLGYASPARADAPASPTDADAAFREGAALFASGKVRLACEKFTLSFKLDPAPGTLKNLALCHVTEGKTASAWRDYLKLAALAEAAGVKKAEQEARGQAAALEKRLSRVTLTLPDAVKLVTFQVDDADVDPTSLEEPLPLDPGPRSLHFVDRDGHDVRVTASVPATPGVTPILVAWPTTNAELPRPPPPPPPPKPQPLPLRPLAWSLFGLATVGISVGSGFGAAAYARRNDHPNDDAFHDATISTVCFTVGLVAAAAGGFVYWQTSPPAPAKLEVTPTAGPHGAGLALATVW